MSNTTYVAGQWNVHCDVCGFRFKSNEIRKRWDGLMVCKDDFEHDHPQKYLRVTERAPSVLYVRKQSDDQFVFFCDLADKSNYVGIATVGCALVGGSAFPTYADLAGVI